ncbi:lipopolysaccharide kinase InaA family protein [Pseudomonas sp. GOM6]|uniref:lipopolysaccharide kinase InaA family protein n=1 Tax=Pseudomonas sp. GOM6 TaxID=3036944 RepID=UPI00240A2286|nr:lipopolysaccharide kinase InaA family protein [Pseudomonas sp. GOM6]MDG1582594.1 lipopolysaccharide kinase InaA family protein [Pseudomonas sp. GOM6]
MQLAQLAQAGREPSLPLTLELAGDELELQRLLRVLPGQRYVGQAQWRGRPVLVKLLVGERAERHYRRELDGARLLAEQDLTTPALLAEVFVEGQGGWLLFDYLEGAESLWGAWRLVEREAPLSEGQHGVLAEALTAIAGMHARGLWQSDLHLDNLLRQQGQLYLIDGGGVQAETPGQPLSRQRVLENLGVFFAQLPAELEPYLEELLIHYLLANGEHALPLEALLKEIAKVRQWRLRDYLKKVGRDCSLFAARVGAFGLRVVRRAQQAELAPLLDDPDAAIAAGRLLKDGGSATVALVQVGDRLRVLKRYNIKGWGHWLKRFWRPSRAWHSWVEGHRLELLGIATPRPLAVREQRWCWLRSRAWLLTEHCAGEDLLTRFAPYLDSTPPEEELQALDQLFAALIRERISHGDCKGTNLFWESGRWTLIDLDAMRQHRSQASFAPAFARDRARFLRNWPQDSALHRLLDQRLPRL